MALPDIFSKPVSDAVIQRINKLTAETQPKWGKMNVAQMLAHCNVAYELVYENKHPQPGFMLRLILKTVVKKHVTNEAPYKPNLRTAPAFLISDERVFNSELKRLVEYIEKTRELGRTHFNEKKSHSFGVLNEEQWNNMFYKHLDHHLSQFGV